MSSDTNNTNIRAAPLSPRPESGAQPDQGPEKGRREKVWAGIFWAGIVLGLAFRLGLYLGTGWTVGDAMITFRFAEQFSLGHGLVFNIGERVSGNTSLLYSLVLGVAGWCGASIPVFAHWFGVVCDLVTVLVLRRIMEEHSGLKSPEFHLGLPAAIFLFPLTFPYSVSGMETSLYVSLVMLLVWRALKRPDWKFYGVATLLMYCRPDSVVFLSATLLFFLLNQRRLPWKPALVIFCVGLTYLAFNRFYYGSVVPNTVLAKATAYQQSWRENYHYLAVRFLRHDLLTTLMLAAVAASCFWRRKSPLVLLLGSMWAGFLLFLLSSPQLRAWYIVPLFYHSLLILGLAAGAWFDSRIAPDTSKTSVGGQKIWQLVPVVGAAAYLLACMAAFPILFKQCRAVTYLMQFDHVEAGRWLRENTPADARIFETALEIGYYSKRYTMDWPGLVTPAVWKMIRQGSTNNFFQFAEALKADYTLLPLDIKAAAPTNFQVVRDFKAPTAVSVPLFQDEGYRLYKRIQP